MTVTEKQDEHRARHVFATFLKLGLTSFGGPTAHIGYFREELVGRRKWLTEQRFGELLALCQFLPGPTSSQLGFAIGLDRAGYRGAVLAWVAFTLPSALLMLAFALGAVHLQHAIGQGILLGLGAVAVAVVAHAVWSLARALTPDLRRVLMAITAGALALLLAGVVGQLAAIVLGVVAGLVFCRTPKDPSGNRGMLVKHVSLRAGIVSLILLALLLTLLPIVALLAEQPLVSLADAFSRAGALVFGGGHVVLPLLQAEPFFTNTVTDEQFLAGYSAAQAVPGPLFTFAAFLGAIAIPDAPLLAAAVGLVAVFLPGMLLLVGVLPFWNRLRLITGASAAIRGANAAVVGILAAALVNPIAMTALTGWVPLVIALAALVLLIARVPAWAIVLLGAAAGALAQSLF